MRSTLSFVGLSTHNMQLRKPGEISKQTCRQSNAKYSLPLPKPQDIQTNRRDVPQIVCTSSEKRPHIKKAIELCQAFDFRFSKLRIDCSSKADTELIKQTSDHNLGLYLPPPEENDDHRIYLRKEPLNDSYIEDRLKVASDPGYKAFISNLVAKGWGQELEAFRSPTWEKNIYSGSEGHIPLHEVGHYFLNIQLQKLIAPLLDANLDWTYKQLGFKAYSLYFNDLRKHLFQNKIRLLDEQMILAKDISKLNSDRIFESDVKLRGQIMLELTAKREKEKDNETNFQVIEELIKKIDALCPPEFTSSERHIVQQYTESEYCADHPKEFVADMFAALISGKKFPSELIELYKKCNGPVSPKFNFEEKTNQTWVSDF